MSEHKPLWIGVIHKAGEHGPYEIKFRGQKLVTIVRYLEERGAPRAVTHTRIESYLDSFAIITSGGFANHKPETITEAHALYHIYVNMDDPNKWPLYIQWCQRFNYAPTEEESSDTFHRTFQGLYDSFADYAYEYFRDHSGMDTESTLSEYVAWDRFVHDLELSGDIVAIKDPQTGRFGMFEDFDQ